MPATIPTFEEAIEDRETCSHILSAALSYLGYSYSAIKERQTTIELLIHLFSQLFPYHIVGSKSEGLTTLHENDMDILYPFQEVVCVDDISDVIVSGARRQLLLIADKDDVSPGYTKLKVLIPDDIRMFNKIITEGCFENRSGDLYLSNILFNIHPNTPAQKCDYTINGPAQTRLHDHRRVIPGLINDVDAVSAIPYKCKKLMQEWKDRPRYYGWPSDETLRELDRQDWHVVPVGSTKEGEGVQEWRICFTFGEVYLVKTLNTTQLQLLILLRYISRKILKPVCPAMSSYIMKNMVLWMAELLPRRVFKIPNLSRLLMLAMATLRRSVDRVTLKNYMIPARNMFKGKVSRDEREILMAHLDSFLLEGPGFIIKEERLSRVSDAMFQVFSNPDDAERKQHKDDVAEVNNLKHYLFCGHLYATEFPEYLLDRHRNEDGDGFILNKFLPLLLKKLPQFLNNLKSESY